MQVAFRRINPKALVPVFQTPGACAFDLAGVESVTLGPGERALVPTGLVIQVPEGYALVIAARSSNAKKGVRLGNGIGIIDQDYHGPTDQIYLALHNFGHEPYTVAAGERIAQGMIVPILKPEFTESPDDLTDGDRGGFGSTG
jgi:dUTP pyrophosphatase